MNPTLMNRLRGMLVLFALLLSCCMLNDGGLGTLEVSVTRATENSRYASPPPMPVAPRDSAAESIWSEGPQRSEQVSEQEPTTDQSLSPAATGKLGLPWNDAGV